ncbi:MAG: DUF4834 domain-containing protein [Flavobacteriales bacterium]|nr:DUF4834 domain-containing protein [Flavobacteriales bacterium]
MGVIKTIFIIVLVYYGIRFIGRIVAPILLKLLFNKAQQRFQDQNVNHSDSDREKGEVRVESKSSKSGTENKSNVEYTDFEEVD